jgi:hypothetical protein
VYAHLADVFRITRHGAPNWGPAEEAMRATVEKGETYLADRFLTRM